MKYNPKTKASAKNSKSNHFTQNQHQQIRNFINSSSHLSRKLNNSSNQNTPVRINPLLLKRNENSAQTSNETITKHQEDQPTNFKTNNILYKNPVMHGQEIEQIQHQINQTQDQLESSFLNGFLTNNNNDFSQQLHDVHDLYSSNFAQINNDCLTNSNNFI